MASVSLHTIHHLPENEHLQAYRELYRVLLPGSSAVVVNGWPSSRLMAPFEPLIRFNEATAQLAGPPSRQINRRSRNQRAASRNCGKVKQK